MHIHVWFRCLRHTQNVFFCGYGSPSHDAFPFQFNAIGPAQPGEVLTRLAADRADRLRGTMVTID